MSNAGILSEKGDVEATGTMTDNKLIRGDGTKKIQDSGITCDDSDNLTGINTLTVVDAATTRTNLGLGSISTQDANNVTITGGSVSGIADISVADGGTGVSSNTAYAVLCGGTTATGAIQSIAGIGSSGEVLTSNGAGALPTFQAVPAGGNYHQGGFLNSANWAYSITPGVSSAGTLGVTDKRLYLIPIFVSESVTIAKVYFDITSAVAGSQARLGIYQFVDTGTFTLVSDYGTVSTASTGIKSVSASSEVITPSNRYYMAFTIDENAGSVSVKSGLSIWCAMDISGANMNPHAYFYYDTHDPASALPASVAITASAYSNTPLIAIGRV